MFNAVVFDVAGTIVTDDGVVMKSFEQAFCSIAPGRWEEESSVFLNYAHETMGQSKIEVFRHLFGSQVLAEQAAAHFQESYLANLKLVTPISGIEQMFKSLRANGIKLALNTGFDRNTLDAMLGHLNWTDVFDATATPTETGQGRPSPAMLQHVTATLNVADSAEVAVIGDTASDMESGVRFGAGLKVGVLTGAHRDGVLIKSGADVVVPDATYVLDLLLD